MNRTTNGGGGTAAGQIASCIEAAWGGWTGPVVETSVFGTREPFEIAALIERWVGEHLGSAVAAAHWYHASVGCTAALTLADGRDVVVKAHQPRFTHEYLRAMTAAQQHLVDHWYPCPAPVGVPAPLGAVGVPPAWVTASTMRTTTSPTGRPDTVSAVAALVRIALEFDASAHLALGPTDLAVLSPHPLQAVTPGALYPEPYSPTFAYRSGDEAAWVDSLAAVARRIVDSDHTERVVTHIDWSPRNLRGSVHGVSDVYDMDSLAVLPETRAVGGAAVSWLLDDSTDVAGSAWLADVEHFLWLYQRIRDRWFDELEMRRVWAAVLWNLAYLARCEDAVGEVLGATQALRAHGANLLERLGSA